MVTLPWSYYEIQDTDFTGVQIEISVGKQLLELWSNFDRKDSCKEVWGNQTESFTLPSLEAARQFIVSAGFYTLVSLQV